MYNRYIPQPDGSYRRRSVADSPSRPSHPSVSLPEPPRQEEECCEMPCQECPHRPQPEPVPKPRREPGCGNFLKNLLPGNLDTEDLLIVLLLLLMSGEGRDDQNLPLLTLALYLFL